MQEYFKYELHTLLDLLAMETERYTKMIAAGVNSGNDYVRCRMSIKILQEVIALKTGKKDQRVA